MTIHIIETSKRNLYFKLFAPRYRAFSFFTYRRIFYNASTIFEQGFHDLLQSSVFDKDAIDKGTGKPHEAMSAIIGINLLEKMDYEYEKEFFARAIMGIEYSSEEEEYQIRNCLIRMLNGSLIDVDKLDYLMRDAYVTGYSTMKIDYERLFYMIVSL